MDMKKVSCALVIAAASMSAAMATEIASPAAAPAPDALAPSSRAVAGLPVIGSLIGASILSFFALFQDSRASALCWHGVSTTFLVSLPSIAVGVLEESSLGLPGSVSCSTLVGSIVGGADVSLSRDPSKSVLPALKVTDFLEPSGIVSSVCVLALSRPSLKKASSTFVVNALMSTLSDLFLKSDSLNTLPIVDSDVVDPSFEQLILEDDSAT
ncbi:arabinogalactan peptide 23-like [Senna tora]|uniref:Arabinogalactan peptide 23-like n=1 Tax=Senna tora TaxID=362788 RepID=A0A834TD12_9FABA|nr:arabinogalactan peptide 23-like [Senna tora]